jgi:hypothetical protein
LVSIGQRNIDVVELIGRSALGCTTRTVRRVLAAPPVSGHVLKYTAARPGAPVRPPVSGDGDRQRDAPAVAVEVQDDLLPERTPLDDCCVGKPVEHPRHARRDVRLLGM